MQLTTFFMLLHLAVFTILASTRSLAKGNSASPPPNYQQFMKDLSIAYKSGDYTKAKRMLIEFEKQGGHPPSGDETSCPAADELAQWKTMMECLSQSSYAAKSWDSIDQAQKSVFTTLRDGKASDLTSFVSCDSLDLARNEIYCDFDQVIARPSGQSLRRLQSAIKQSGLDVSKARWESSPGPAHSKGGSALKLSGFDSSNKPSFRATTKKVQGSTEGRPALNDWVIEVAKYRNGRVYISALPLINDH
ncbi:MAG: hypothetical protein FJ146_19605 [Deltaproteobacteria bacterium]|nr:hypothetical protein [Deltaproteobacteria bacterium]